jgi:hypothetical protein
VTQPANWYCLCVGPLVNHCSASHLFYSLHKKNTRILQYDFRIIRTESLYVTKAVWWDPYVTTLNVSISNHSSNTHATWAICRTMDVFWDRIENNVFFKWSSLFWINVRSSHAIWQMMSMPEIVDRRWKGYSKREINVRAFCKFFCSLDDVIAKRKSIHS